jgi:hypothetical protein
VLRLADAFDMTLGAVVSPTESVVLISTSSL